MKQALHILRKDLRYLWREFALVALLAAGYAWSEMHSLTPIAQLLLGIAAIFAIARLVHAETIPGDRQFWITRPYEWRSLLAAKVLAILLCVIAPIFIARLYVVIELGFPVATSLPRLLWSQFLMMCCVALPVAALAAVTPTTLSFMFCALAVLATASFYAPALYALDLQIPQWPAGVQWVRNSLLGIVAVTVAVPMLYLQYRERRTAMSRSVAVILIVVGFLACWHLPLTLAFDLQSLLSRASFNSDSLEITIAESPRTFRKIFDREGVLLSIPLIIRGVPENNELRPEDLTLSFLAPDGNSWNTDAVVYAANEKASNGAFDAGVVMDPQFFAAYLEQPLSVHGSFYLSLFGEPREQTVSLQDKTAVVEGMRCARGVFDFVVCRSPFQWPSELVSLKVGPNIHPIWAPISYSPLPSGLSLDTFVEHGTGGLSNQARNATIVIREPIAHFRRDFEIANVVVKHLAQSTK